VFDGWTSSQTINVQGKSNQQAFDTWGRNWNRGCRARIRYSQ